jgi:hypothetical protein
MEMQEKGGGGGGSGGSKPELRPGYVLGKFKDAALSSLTNRYMLANTVYLAYTIGILVIGAYLGPAQCWAIERAASSLCSPMKWLFVACPITL